MNDRSRMMLYALTAVACVMWIWQSVKESMNDGTIISTSNIKPNKPKKTNTTTLPTPQTPTPQTPKKTTTHSTKGTSWMQPHCQ